MSFCILFVIIKITKHMDEKKLALGKIVKVPLMKWPLNLFLTWRSFEKLEEIRGTSLLKPLFWRQQMLTRSRLKPGASELLFFYLCISKQIDSGSSVALLEV